MRTATELTCWACCHEPEHPTHEAALMMCRTALPSREQEAPPVMHRLPAVALMALLPMALGARNPRTLRLPSQHQFGTLRPGVPGEQRGRSHWPC
jgi:hypothetical protein